MMLSGEYSYTFGSVVKAVGRVRCLEKLWKLKVFCEVSLEWDRFWAMVEAIAGFVEVFPGEGSRKFVLLDILRIPLRIDLRILWY